MCVKLNDAALCLSIIMLIAEKTDASFEYNEDSGGEVEEDDVLPEEGSKKRDKRRKHRDHGREKRRKSKEDHHKVCMFS